MKHTFSVLLAFLIWGCFSAIAYGDGLTQLPLLQAAEVRALHQNGQTFVTWQEIDRPIPMDAPSGKDFHVYKGTGLQNVRYHIYTAPHPILTVEGMTAVASLAPLSGWNQSAYGIDTALSDKTIPRYVISPDGIPLSNGTGLWVHNPDLPGTAYYAVTVSINGIENTAVSPLNATLDPLMETVGTGYPILQRIETPEDFLGAVKPTLYYYTRWEGPPNSSVEGKAFDYLVGIPQTLADPAPVGIHMHCWGGSQDSGYAWWNDAEDGAILLASNQDPYDWWTGYHEKNLTALAPKTPLEWQTGVVHPYTTNRLFSFLYWMHGNTAWPVDLYRTFTAGSSMGGSGSMMTGIRNGGTIAWVRSAVGVHIPGETTTMRPAYAANFGDPENGVLFENGIPVWNYYDDAWYLRNNPAKEVPFLTFSNAKNDPLIDWPQAVRFYQALQDTKRPHLFVWGQDGHNQMAKMPLTGGEQTMPIDIRVNQSLPAFTRCSLDDFPGNGDPADGAPQGQINGYLYWETADIIDTADSWEISVALTDTAPRNSCTVDITARRLQNFKVPMGWHVTWENRDAATGSLIASGIIYPDSAGLLTIPQTVVSKGKNRIILRK